jgi:hypothetical protein
MTSVDTDLRRLKKDIDLRIGRLFENLKKGHRSEVQMSVTSIWVLHIYILTFFLIIYQLWFVLGKLTPSWVWTLIWVYHIYRIDFNVQQNSSFQMIESNSTTLKGSHSKTCINGELIILPESMVNSLFYLYQWWTHYFTPFNGELIILPVSVG